MDFQRSISPLMTTTHAGREPIRRAARNSAAIGILPARAFLAIALTFVLGCSPQDRPGIDAAPAADRELASNANSAVVPFSDRAQELGIQFTYRNGADAKLSPILESLGGGLGWCDFDRDGWLDLAVVAGGHFPSEKSVAGRASGLFRNLDGKQFVSVGDVAGIENSQLYTNGITIGDYDNDGFQDLLISGYGRPQLWHNLGDGTFKEESAAAGILDDRWGSSAAWADLNGDGDLDLYLEHYVNWSFDNHPYCGGSTPETRDNCPPRDFQPLPDRVYFSQGDGSFADATTFAGLREDGKGLACCSATSNRMETRISTWPTIPPTIFFTSMTGKEDSRRSPSRPAPREMTAAFPTAAWAWISAISTATGCPTSGSPTTSASRSPFTGTRGAIASCTSVND